MNESEAMKAPSTPGEVDVTIRYSKHLGPRYEAAGLRLQFHYNQAPGVRFCGAVNDEYRASIERGISDAMARRFPDFPANGSIWIVEVDDDPVASSQVSFYHAAVAAVEQAYVLAITTPRERT